MANKRKLTLREYGISDKRLKELCGFCEQYPEWIEELKYHTSTLKGKMITEISSGTFLENETEVLAIRREELHKKCELVEQAAIKADAELYPYLIKSVCYEVPYWYLRDILEMPMSRTSFMASRRKFFSLLNCKKGVP